MRRTVFLCLLPFLTVPAQSSELPRGEIIPEVVCTAQPRYSYALYVPTDYNPDRPTPVLYCLDPQANGLTPVRLFRDAAEQLGYIVAGSLNSRNGPWNPAADAIEAMVTDLAAHWNIDPRQSYATGFSGGARGATTLAEAGIVRGVIACGAGFMQGRMPEEVTFDFYGICGRDDFNRPELERLDRVLDRLGGSHHLTLFSGGHEWLPASAALPALQWLHDQRLHANMRQRYQRMIDVSFRRGSKALAKLPLPDAWLEGQLLQLDYAGLVDLSDLTKSQRKLRRAREVRAKRQTLQAWEQRHETLLRKITDEIARGDLTGLTQRLAELPAQESAEVAFQKRLLQGVLIRALAEARDGFAANDFDAASAQLRAATRLLPQNALMAFDLACALSLANQPADAISSLQRAVQLGVKDARHIRETAALETLHRLPEFQAILAELPASP